MSRRATSSKRGRAKQPPERDWIPSLLLAGKAFLALTLSTSVVLGLWWTNQRAEALVAQDGPDIEIQWLPVDQGGEAGSWPPVEQQSLILSRCYEVLGDDAQPFDTQALDQLAQSVLESGWVVDVEDVHREPGRRIVVSPRWAIPTAVVRGADFDYLIAADGRPLPLRYRRGASAWKALVGLGFDPAGVWSRDGASEPITVEGVYSGLAVLEAIKASVALDQISAIDVTQPNQVVLLTDRGTRVVWGSPPGLDRPGEVGTATKLERLNFFRTSADDGYRVDAGLDRLDISGRSVLIDESRG